MRKSTIVTKCKSIKSTEMHSGIEKDKSQIVSVLVKGKHVKKDFHKGHP